ncbi:TPA: LysR family transcriptional regulator [Vibrio parahaemolyticus]|uniref:LysR family transcriptional regulator n=1 Tax=Vibrio parahaemolyticus TaxID=670 RepID=UPI000E328680|nr:LysR family transcriptional regulator [Vibrio parahaemolyticus]MBE4058135.1 LysR family transcriptional regulator [Vibrio parahaemolyticus]MBE4154830.1 LysR family transcriptional regulator [Vibrio parahaemolyticus]MDS1922482.1 LysR family transcriptional regulator [Vibrio parahaemolyticus]RFD40307.1 DNA-binding transcriptional regulator [Vibrio parahaemolyticus]HCG6130148.1 LysR family transcriptional regulator [Vibrio parahaemolyticus]
MKKSLARLDLNLLFTLQLLLQEQSVSKASKKLNVTPSTVSKSLNKLRHWFDDPLFVKTPKGLAPTPLAQSMEQDLAEWLQIGSQIAEKRSDITPKGVRFDITIESPLVLTVLDRLIVARSKESLDLLPYFLDFEILFYDLPMVYLHKDHPALQQEWNLETFLSYQHINIVWEKSETWALDEVLTELGLQRSIGLTMSNFEQSLFMAAQPTHGMITTAPRYCKSYTEKLHLDLVCLPIPLDQTQQDKLLIPFTMIWHKRNAYNPKLLWLKNTIKSLYEQPSLPQ